ncbi:MAG TPA: AAA family ATPase [Ktedonobacterales bacterium]
MGRRIVIVGAPGAGKTTLAQRLAANLGIPCHPLDPVAFVDEHWSARSLNQRQRMIADIVVQPCWVAEGVHLGWTTPLLAAADLIVWLDPPWWTLLWRATIRRLRRWRQRQPLRLSIRDLRALWVEDWLFVGRYYWQGFQPGMDLDSGRNLSRAATAAALAPYAPKLRHSRASRLSAKRLARFTAELMEA